MYDIFAYDPTYIKNFSPYLLDLEDWLSKDYLDQYSSSDSLKLSVYNGHRYGIPLFVVYMILYSNIFYLNKYGKDIPTTWDELIETSKIIIDEEYYNNNKTNLIGYNGFFPGNILSFFTL
ncbi:hypothetical protein H8356DRAFT_631111 [Neocallimastix lanati (nom. inval.)]|nr:hypothetical protein H8356DRAFT_631111 [Neocallimastix sp. JGI-2020a]